MTFIDQKMYRNKGVWLAIVVFSFSLTVQGAVSQSNSQQKIQGDSPLSQRLSASQSAPVENSYQFDEMHNTPLKTSSYFMSENSFSNPYDRKYGAAVGIQFPTGVFLELNYRPLENFSFGIGGGGFSLGGLHIDNGIQQNGVPNTISTKAFEARARWHVMNRSFFLGLSGGWQSITVSGIDGSSLNSGSIDRFYFTPHLGWMWVMDSGLTLGTEVGFQVPMSTPNITLEGIKGRSAEKFKDVSYSLLPYLTLIKVGYTF